MTSGGLNPNPKESGILESTFHFSSRKLAGRKMIQLLQELNRSLQYVRTPAPGLGDTISDLCKHLARKRYS